jgi:putative transcriptional regulator
MMPRTNPSGGRPATGDRMFNRLAVLRAERGLTRRALAEALGVNPQTIGYVERGLFNPSLELAFRLSELFGVPIQCIFARTPFAPVAAPIGEDRIGWAPWSVPDPSARARR